jgi:dTDP-4-amino-4,6-dideoxygalactose transaminase
MSTVSPEDRSGRPAILGGTPTFEEPVFVARSRIPSWDRLGARLQEVLSTRRLTNNGPVVQELEAALRARLQTGFCIATANGTIGLQLALRALELQGEVITTPFTFPATVHAIEWNGLEPVFCDIDAETYNLSPELVSGSITERTSAVLPVHVFGNPCDIGGFDRLAGDHALRVLYDAAHAFGVEIAGCSVFEAGDLSVLSFHATKLFHSAEGGAVVGASEEDRRANALLRNFGIVNEEEVSGVGLNAKLSELHAALGLELLPLMEDEIACRAEIAARYEALLGATPGVRFQKFEPTTKRNHAYFTIEIDADEFGLSRNELHRALGLDNIVTRKYFHPLASQNPSYRGLPSAAPELLPNATRLATRVLCLPIYGELLPAEADAIANTVLGIARDPEGVRDALSRQTEAS